MANEKIQRISISNLEQNFVEVEPGLTTREAVEESNRCLYCYDAPCIKACPTGIDIPTFIKKIASGNLLGSAKTIMSSIQLERAAQGFVRLKSFAKELASSIILLNQL